MIFDSTAPSASTEFGGVETASPPSRALMKYVPATVPVACLYLSSFLEFSFSELSDWLFLLFVLCLPVMLFLTLRRLFQRRWKESVMLLAAGALIFLPAFGVGEPLQWVRSLGFRLHISPVEQYLSGCRLIDFFENDTRRTVGECESHGMYSGHALTVIYDPSGEILKPVSQRTQEWQRAMSEFYSEEVLNSSERRTRHLFSDFYVVGSSLAEERG